MSSFLDGPAGGRSLGLRRAPHFLRVVTSGVLVDALDQLDDSPLSGETVHVYEMISFEFRGFVCRSGSGSGFQESAVYRHRHDADGEALRDAAAWRAWCRAQPVPEGVVDVTR